MGILWDWVRKEIKFQSKAWLRKQIIYKDKDNRQQIRYGKKFQNFNEFLKKGDVVLLKKQDTIYSISQIPKVNGAIVVINPNTGRVLAMTGGYQFNKSEFNIKSKGSILAASNVQTWNNIRDLIIPYNNPYREYKN